MICTYLILVAVSILIKVQLIIYCKTTFYYVFNVFFSLTLSNFHYQEVDHCSVGCGLLYPRVYSSALHMLFGNSICLICSLSIPVILCYICFIKWAVNISLLSLSLLDYYSLTGGNVCTPSATSREAKPLQNYKANTIFYYFFNQWISQWDKFFSIPLITTWRWLLLKWNREAINCETHPWTRVGIILSMQRSQVLSALCYEIGTSHGLSWGKNRGEGGGIVGSMLHFTMMHCLISPPRLLGLQCSYFQGLIEVT